MNKYEQLKNKQQAEIDKLPIGAAFSNKQFAEMMEKWGLTVNDTDKILSLGAGCYIRKSDEKAIDETFKRHQQEKKDAIAEDATGDGFITNMFLYELANHEYCITYDLTDTIDALDLTIDEINADKRLLHGLKKARAKYLRSCDEL